MPTQCGTEPQSTRSYSSEVVHGHRVTPQTQHPAADPVLAVGERGSAATQTCTRSYFRSLLHSRACPLATAIASRLNGGRRSHTAVSLPSYSKATAAHCSVLILQPSDLLPSYSSACPLATAMASLMAMAHSLYSSTLMLWKVAFLLRAPSRPHPPPSWILHVCVCVCVSGGPHVWLPVVGGMGWFAQALDVIPMR